MFSYLLLISVLFSNHGLILSERKYHIIPSLGDFCPEDPCLTLSQFAENSDIYTNSNTTLIFTPGTHVFNYGSLVIIENVDTFAMLSNTSSVVSTVWIAFISVANVFISNLTFIRCNFHFERVQMLTVENCTFFNNTAALLVLELSSAYFANSRFISNSGGPVRLTISGSSRSYSAGAVVIMHASSTFVCKNCSFQRNIADVGGVVFARLQSNLTFIDCSFVSNHARKFGGALYTEKFCTVSIFNSSFYNNSAMDRGGAVSVSGTNLFINACVFSHCKSKEGGVIYADVGLISNKSVISNVGGLLVISGSNFTFNSASSIGGVLASNTTNVTVNDHSRFTNNMAIGNGGVMYTDGGHIRISDRNIFFNCTAYRGGVLASFGSTVVIQESVFHHNKANESGGVIYAIKKHDQGSMIITESEFFANLAPFGFGGVLNSEGIGVSFINCKVESNKAGFGGAMYADQNLIVYGSILSNNAAKLLGGALAFSGNLIINITNSQLIDNSADEAGGAIYMESTNVTISNCTFDSNRATETGGAISLQGKSHLEISTSVVRNNLAEYGAGIFCTDKGMVTTNNITAIRNIAIKQGILCFIESSATFTHGTSIFDNTGSLFFFYSNITFRDTTIIDNGTSAEGGAVTAFLSIVSFDGLTILRYNSAAKGGAIHATSSKMYVCGKTLV